jgi:predicted DNA-binding transcriptional regulator AlpA
MKKRNATAGHDRFIYTNHILAHLGISDRCLRKWVKDGRFPRPNGNLHGRNFWLISIYRRWVAAVMAGRFGRAPTNLTGAFRLRRSV